MTDEAVGLLRELVTLQRETLAVLRRQVAAEPLADRLVREVHRLLGDEGFTAPELVAIANTRLSTRSEIRAIAQDIIRGPIDDAGAGRRFGRFLASNVQHEVDGLRLISVGQVRGAIAYRIEACNQNMPMGKWAPLLTD